VSVDGGWDWGRGDEAVILRGPGPRYGPLLPVRDLTVPEDCAERLRGVTAQPPALHGKRERVRTTPCRWRPGSDMLRACGWQ
jgi:hypothetical protein